jgi:hypothetical protein
MDKEVHKSKMEKDQELKKRLEPWDELSNKNLKKVNILTDAAFQAVNSKEVNLATDPIKVPGQNWACVSFVSKTANQKCEINGAIGMKIRGVFDTREEANAYVQRLIRLDPMFDIYVCDMYNWCLVPPDPELITDQNYQDETLHNIISEYRKNQIYAKEHFEERKREMMEQAADELKRAALKKFEEESQKELEESHKEHGDFKENHNSIVDITEIENKGSDIGIIGGSGEFITASELMESMRNGFKVKEN